MGSSKTIGPAAIVSMFAATLVSAITGTALPTWRIRAETSRPYTRPEPFKSRYASAPYDGEIAVADISSRACELAKHIQTRAVELQTPAERRQQAELDRMLQHPDDKVTLTQWTDQGFRSHRATW